MIYRLRDYQQAAADAGIRYFLNGSKGQGALMVLPTGSGKSLVIAEIARQLNSPIVIFQPTKEILEQNFQKYINYGLPASIFSASVGFKRISKVTFATIGSAINRLNAFQGFPNIIVDECFPAGTIVDGKAIETIRAGDFVRSFNHDTGRIEFKKVVRLFRKPANTDLIKIGLSCGSSLCCTENHPIWVKRYGYVPAKTLYSLGVNEMPKGAVHEQEKNLFLQGLRERMQTEKSRQDKHLLQPEVCGRRIKEESSSHNDGMLYVRKRDCHRRNPENEFQQDRKSVLLERMLQGNSGVGTIESIETCNGGPCMAETCVGAHEKEESHVDARNKRQNDRIFQGESFCFEGWKRKDNETANGSASSDRINNGASHCYRPSKTSLLSHASLLQGGPSGPTDTISNRSRRQITQGETVEVARCEEDGNIEFVRVDSVEVHKQGSGREFGCLCRDNYVYNIEVEGNHNYFANNVLVHNCHLVNPKKGMYKDFLGAIGGKVLGLTATPYRLTTDGYGGSILNFLTRTRPRVFHRVIHVTQNQDLFERGYLARLEYSPMKGFDSDRLRLNSTGADYTDESVRQYYQEIDFTDTLSQTVVRCLNQGRKSILIFTRFVEESQALADRLPGIAEIVTAKTRKKDREGVIARFRSGQTKVVTNVGILNIGFDFPELETIIIARPTMSLALYYQMIGRGIRPHPDKDSTWAIDLCDNYRKFGRVEDLRIVAPRPHLWHIESKGKQLTNIYFGDRKF